MTFMIFLGTEITQDEIYHEIFQTGSLSYLKFGDKKQARSRVAVSRVEPTVVSRSSSVPRLPSISPARTTTNGLRKLQQHLESVQEDLEETDVSSS